MGTQPVQGLIHEDQTILRIHEMEEAQMPEVFIQRALRIQKGGV